MSYPRIPMATKLSNDKVKRKKSLLTGVVGNIVAVRD
jgi:hypothetical protein